MPASRRRSLGAFTLIELLVVMAITSLLIALLMPALAKARAAARMSICLSGVRQTSIAALLYTSSNKDYFPAAQSGAYGYQAVLVDQDYADRSLFYVRGGCPYGPANYSNSTGDPLRAGSGASTGSDVIVSYTLNGYLQAGFGKPDGGPPYIQNGSTGTSWCYYGPQRTTLGRVVKRPTYMMLTACSPTAGSHESRENQFWPLLFILGHTYSATTFPIDPGKVRHEGQALPMAMIDGHGEPVAAKVLTGGQTNVLLSTPLSWYRTYTIGVSIPVVSLNPLYDGANARRLLGD